MFDIFVHEEYAVFKPMLIGSSRSIQWKLVINIKFLIGKESERGEWGIYVLEPIIILAESLIKLLFSTGCTKYRNGIPKYKLNNQIK